MRCDSSTSLTRKDKPFFLWYNTTAMHFRTHCAKKHKGKAGRATITTSWSRTTSTSGRC